MQIWTLVAALSGFLAVALGAFGAHGLKDVLSGEMQEVFQTANRYHFYHTLVLLWIGSQSFEVPVLKWAGVFMLGGLILFSGSLYVLSVTQIRWLGAITPLGGLGFLIGWGLLAYYAWRG